MTVYNRDAREDTGLSAIAPGIGAVLQWCADIILDTVMWLALVEG